ncbi:MAG TPA: metalloregulator ArsR/SmtB family transcription factor [Galbitalea sp.]|nr:metalloregulator ArsR/SmtB family transcription factor [Galbitalea sp.]
MTASAAPALVEGLVPTFAALADQTRWDILTRLGARELSASALAAEFPVSRQAIAKHLAALSGAGLVEAVRSGREIRYRALGARLSEIANQLDRIGNEWDARLARIRAIAERL